MSDDPIRGFIVKQYNYDSVAGARNTYVHDFDAADLGAVVRAIPAGSTARDCSWSEHADLVAATGAKG